MLDLLTRISTLYNIPQWAVNTGAITIFIILVAFPFVARKLMEPKHRKFKELPMYNVVWRWKYKKDEIVGLWCHCPQCHGMLMCDDENCRATEELQDKITFFVCHECGGHEQGRVVGGDRRYAISLVKREALRQIRTGDYVATMKLAKELKDALAAFEARLKDIEEQNELAKATPVEIVQEVLESDEATILTSQVEEPLLIVENEIEVLAENIPETDVVGEEVKEEDKAVVETEEEKQKVEVPHGV